jgi:hypothetical protein
MTKPLPDFVVRLEDIIDSLARLIDDFPYAHVLLSGEELTGDAPDAPVGVQYYKVGNTICQEQWVLSPTYMASAFLHKKQYGHTPETVLVLATALGKIRSDLPDMPRFALDSELGLFTLPPRKPSARESVAFLADAYKSMRREEPFKPSTTVKPKPEPKSSGLSEKELEELLGEDYISPESSAPSSA